MKTVKGKYIRLTESQLHEIIKETVKKEVSLLMEYSMPRAKYVENICNLFQQILENWMLVRYCTLVGRTETKKHWKSELWTHLNNIATKKIKGKDSDDAKRSAINQALDICDAFEAELNSHKVSPKFYSEGILVDNETKLLIAKDFVNDIPNMVNCILSMHKGFDVDGYLDSI